MSTIGIFADRIITQRPICIIALPGSFPDHLFPILHKPFWIKCVCIIDSLLCALSVVLHLYNSRRLSAWQRTSARCWYLASRCGKLAKPYTRYLPSHYAIKTRNKAFPVLYLRVKLGFKCTLSRATPATTSRRRVKPAQPVVIYCWSFLSANIVQIHCKAARSDPMGHCRDSFIVGTQDVHILLSTACLSFFVTA